MHPSVEKNYPPSALKLITSDEVIPSCDEEVYVVKVIVAHKQVAPGMNEYKVRWDGDTEDDGTWTPARNFSKVSTLMGYRKRIGQMMLQQESLT